MILYSAIRPLFKAFCAVFMPPKIVCGKEHLDQEGAVIYCANHRSADDPFLLATQIKRQIRFMAKKELFAKQPLRFFMERFGAFPVDRSRADIASIRKAIAYLKAGEAIGIFPEGTRNRDVNAMGQMHDGAAWIAQKSGAPIVPIFIDNRGLFHAMRFYVGQKLTFDRRDGGNTRQEAGQKLADALHKLEQMAQNTSEQ